MVISLFDFSGGVVSIMTGAEVVLENRPVKSKPGNNITHIPASYLQCTRIENKRLRMISPIRLYVFRLYQV